MLEFRYDKQLLIEGEDLDEDVISDYFTENFKGDCLLAVGDEDLINNDEGSIKKLQVNMVNIRKKLGARPGEKNYIVNELGVGYRMCEADEETL